MKVAIIGAHTFIGARLTEMYHLGDGPTVVAVSRWPGQHVLAGRFAVTLRTADPLDPRELGAALRGARAAVHLQPTSVADAQRSFGALCQAAATHGVRRLVFVSGAHAALAGATEPPDTNEDPLAAHVSIEKQFLEDCRRERLSGIVLRVGAIYGPRSQSFAELIARLHERRWPDRDWSAAFAAVYADNVGVAVREALRPKAPDQRVYAIRDAESLTWGDVAQTLAREFDLPAPRPRAPAETPAPVPRTPGRSSARGIAPGDLAALGYAPAVATTAGLQRSCAWWRFAQGATESLS